MFSAAVNPPLTVLAGWLCDSHRPSYDRSLIVDYVFVNAAQSPKIIQSRFEKCSWAIVFRTKTKAYTLPESRLLDDSRSKTIVRERYVFMYMYVCMCVNAKCYKIHIRNSENDSKTGICVSNCSNKRLSYRFFGVQYPKW